MVITPNFSSHRTRNTRLVMFGAQAEQCCRKNPSPAVVKRRQLADFLVKLSEAIKEILRRLSRDCIFPKKAANSFGSKRR